MDQKHFANLDPKLKEVYERVMGTTVNLSQPQQPAQVLPVSPQQNTTTGVVTPIPPPQTMHTTYKPEVFTAEHHKDAREEKKHTADTATGEKKKTSAAGVIIAICGLLFFVAYTIFWMRLFNLSVPFLPF